MAFRIFVAGDEIRCEQAPEGAEEAMEIMAADRVPLDTAAKFVVAAGRTGRDPVAFAKHYVKLRQGLRDSKQGR